ncbi:MAG: Verru/Chthon cassette protein A, partial [Spartobacteria bacterium]
APGVNHPGKAGFDIAGNLNAIAPADHHWLDYFWMPVVEPWAISETFSTAGKINMNHSIAPFSYIRRTTALEAVLGSSGITAVSSLNTFYGNTVAQRRFKKDTTGAQAIPSESLFDVNVTETLKGFDNRLAGNSALFRTASEICELPIVPVATGATYTSMTNNNPANNWWKDWQYTGDNTKEATYNDIYPRLTTKSNTYTVHYRVQMLKKLPGGTQSTWDESRDKVTSELRGSTLIERFLDPNATYPDYATAFSTSASLETYYRFRVLQRSQFTP